VSSIGDAVIATDAQGRGHLPQLASRRKLIGWKPVRGGGQTTRRCVQHRQRGDEGAGGRNPVQMVLETGRIQGLANHTVLISPGTGPERPIDDSAAPHQGRSGRDGRGVVLVFHDVTEKHKGGQGPCGERGTLSVRSFSSMVEGCCVIEMIFDRRGARPVDYRFLALNPAFEIHTGAQGTPWERGCENLPRPMDAHWFEIYGKVAVTGEFGAFRE